MLQRFFNLLLILLALLPGGSSLAQDSAPGTNLREGCVSDYDPAIDYFPEKVRFDHAQSVSVSYFNHYKVVEVLTPWVGAENPVQYVLLQCGTPAPEGFDEAQLIEVPAGEVIAMSTTYLPHLVALGVVDQLIGLDSTLYTNTPEVRERIEHGNILEIGSGSSVNIEVALDADPDLIMTYGSGFPEYDAYPLFEEAGLPYILNADFTEADPLGRAEWLKFTALFFNAEAEANAHFNEIAGNYAALLALTHDLPEEAKPLVLPNTFLGAFGDIWNVPGLDSYAGRLLQDAGARVVFQDSPELSRNPIGNTGFSFEAVLVEGQAADVWLTNAFQVRSLDDLLLQDERYAEFTAFESGQVYNNNARENEQGGNDYFESGVLRPDVILADLIHILHPELLPDHTLVYHQRLE